MVAPGRPLHWKGLTKFATGADLTPAAFPSSAVAVSLGQDAEDESHRYITLDVEADGLTADELLAGQRAWS